MGIKEIMNRLLIFGVIIVKDVIKFIANVNIIKTSAR